MRFATHALALLVLSGCATTRSGGDRFHSLPSAEQDAFRRCQQKTWSNTYGNDFGRDDRGRVDLIAVAVDGTFLAGEREEYAGQPGLAYRVDWLVARGCPREQVMATIAPGVALGGPASKSASTTYAFAELQTKATIRGLKFGAKQELVEGLADCGPSPTGKTTLCSRPDEKKTIGGADVERIAYAFYKGRLSRVIIFTKGAANTAGLRRALEKAYGRGGQKDVARQEYEWPGYAVTLTLKVNEAAETGQAIFMGEEMIALEMEDQTRSSAAADLQ